MVACDQLLNEVRRGLASSYFRERVSKDESVTFVAMLRALAAILPDPVSPPAILRDPFDDYLVALAREASAEAIITGDRDLLDHQGLEPPALTPRQACARLDLRSP